MASDGNAGLSIGGYSRFTNDYSINNSSETELPLSMARTDEAQGDEPKDVPLEIGGVPGDNRNHTEMPGEFNLSPGSHWEKNYHEAAIYLEEGDNNDKFDSHPKDAQSLAAYAMVHNPWYYGVDFVSSMILLALAFVENPPATVTKLPVAVHGAIELLSLSVIGSALALKLRWIGWRTLLKHKRTAIKCITLIVMVAEAFVVLIRDSSHYRVTRALRPIFVVDTKHCGGVRRFIRQILQSVPPILDMLVLLLLLVSVYSVLGYFLFNEDPFFRSLPLSFTSLFVLLTTANFPDIMMHSYAKSKWNAIFFISYLSLVLYVMMNLMLAVVYETFTAIEMDKFRKLLVHKRAACQFAFQKLISEGHPDDITFKHFRGLFKYYAPHKSTTEVALMFKFLDKGCRGRLCIDDFYEIYDAHVLKWRGQMSEAPWYHDLWAPLQTICQYCYNIVISRFFNILIYFMIFGNLLGMVVRAFNFGERENVYEDAKLFCAAWDSILFVSLCASEVALKMLAFGVKRFFNSGWSIFDFTATVLWALGIIIINVFPAMTLVAIFRPLRLLRLFKMKKRYRDVFGTVVLLSPLMCSAAVVLLIMYYFFAIVGMELFGSYDMRNCCVNTSVENYFKYDPNATSAGDLPFYLNTFQDILTSGVTLFELTVVNNWFIIMEGYVNVTKTFVSRLYFQVFYLFTMVVLTIVVASVLQAFRFRIHYKRHTNKKDEEKMLHEEIHLNWDELTKWVKDPELLSDLQNDLVVGGVTSFIGKRPRNREVLQKRMYKKEIDEWMDQEETRRFNANSANIQQEFSGLA